MFNTNIFGNDDDIFDDTKSLSDHQSASVSDAKSYDFNRKEDFDKAMRSVMDVLNNLLKNDGADIEEARRLVKHLKDAHGVELNNFLATFRIKLASTILDGSGSWVESYQTHVIPKSIFYALDVLCENRFSLVNKFFDVELENAKRIVISRFLQEVFLSRLQENINTISDIFNAGLDSRYIKTYYEALYDINKFTIFQNNGVYEALGAELDMPCNQKILDGEEISIDDLSSQNYSDLKFTAAINPVLRQAIAEKVAEYTTRYVSNGDQKAN